MLDEGYVKIWRTILKWEWYKVEHTKTIFLHLIFTANLHDSKWRGITVKRGQRITSRNHLAEETGISEQQARTAIKHLISTNEITIESTSEYSLITVVNFEDYQGNCKEITKQSTKRVTINQPTTNQPSTSDQPLIKNDKKDKNDKNTNNSANGANKTESDEFVFDDGTVPAEIKTEWAAFVKMRKDTKHPLSEYAKYLALNKLNKLAKDNYELQKEILNNSVLGSYQGLFLPNGTKAKTGVEAQPASYDMAEVKRSQTYDPIVYEKRAKR